MALTFVEPGAHPPILNILMYGPPGVGKTTGAISAPGPILYLNAEGPNAVQFARGLYGDNHVLEVAVDSPDVLDQAYLYLRDATAVKTVVLDSIGAIHRVLLEHYSGGGKPTLPNYGDTATKIERFCRTLVKDVPVNVVLIAHERALPNEEIGGFERLPFTGTSNPDLAGKLMEMVDVVAYCGRRDPASGEEGETAYLAQLVDGGGRKGKDRTGLLGLSRPVDLTEWVGLWAGRTKRRTTTTTKPEAVAA